MIVLHVPSLILVATGIGFVLFGGAYALWPTPMARFTDVELPTSSARADFAATYGGFQLGFGCFLLICASTTGWIKPGLVAAAAALAGFAGVRSLGIVTKRGPLSRTIWIALGIELTGLALNLLAVRHMR
jgi:hypothetical protein